MTTRTTRGVGSVEGHPDQRVMRLLQHMKIAMLEVAASDTAYDPDAYQGGLHSHCGPVSYTIQKLCKAELVSGRVQGEAHLWNKLVEGWEVDLTSEQYGGDGYLPVGTGRIIPPRKTVNPRFSLFFDRFLKAFT